MRFIDRGQQLDVGPRVARRETTPPVNGRLDLTVGCVTSHKKAKIVLEMDTNQEWRELVAA
jgi:hypothetical protein